MSKSNSYRKNIDGVTTACSEFGLPKECCWMCGAVHGEVLVESTPEHPSGYRDTTKHEPWCEQITRKIYDDFQGTFREIYNVLELSLEGKKLDIAKSLIGNKIMEARNQAIERVVIFNKN